jgi:predicted nucleic acid-binding protein
MTLPYVDTSALAKLYVLEADSDAFEAWFADAMPVAISLLARVEMASLLRKHARTGRLDAARVAEIEADLEGDVAAGCIVVVDVPAATLHLARALIANHSVHGLRTLDALQLASAIGSSARTFVTADDKLAGAARACGLQVVGFGGA